MAEVILVQPMVGLLDNIKTAPALPLSLLTAVKLVVKEFSVKLIDQRVDSAWEKSLKRELKKKPLLVGTTAMLGPQIEFTRQAAFAVKKLSPKTLIVLGGPHASILPEQTLLDPLIDIVVEGDGEETFLKLSKALKRKQSLKNIPGLYFKKDGKVVYTGPSPQVDLNNLPELPYYLVDVKRYLPRRGEVPALDMETSRGCPYHCRFCYNPCFNKGRWRALKAEVVLKQVKKVVEDYQIKGIWFVDDEFFIDLARAKKILLGLKEMGVRWTIQGVTARSILRMDDKFLKMLEESGCEQLNIGAESGSGRILKMVNKGIVPKELLEVNLKLKIYKIMPWYYFMIGFPHEKESDVEKTLQLILRLLRENPNAKVSAVGCFTPYPGTELFEEAKKLGFNPPKKFADWQSFAVDQINVPWLFGKKRQMVEGVQLTSFFIDEKIRDVTFSPYLRSLAKFYQPIAKFRINHRFWGLPLDIALGNYLKRRLARGRIVI